MRSVPAAAGIVLLGAGALATPAFAQTFPAERAWGPFGCAGGGPMVDAVGDHAGALHERDLVGAAAAPAAFRAADADFLSLRLRLDRDPRQGPNLRPFAWGFAFGADRSRYQALVTVADAERTVNVYRNTAVTVPDSGEDPADAPPLAANPFATHGRVSSAGGRSGGDPDFFLEMAVRWSDLAMADVRPASSVAVWAASSSAPDRLDGDFACHDGRSGAARLSAAGSDPAAPRADGAAGAAGGSPGGMGGRGRPQRGGRARLRVRGGEARRVMADAAMRPRAAKVPAGALIDMT